MLEFILSSISVSPILLLLLAICYLKNKENKESWQKEILNYSFKNKRKEVECENANKRRLTADKKDITNDFKICFEGKNINFKKGLIFKYNRLYISLYDLQRLLGYNIKNRGRSTYLLMDNNKIIINYENGYFISSFKKCFRVPAVYYNEEYYLSLIDICEIFNLITVWNYNDKEILLFKNRREIIRTPREKLTKPALIRFEDITAGDEYDNAEKLLRLRIVTDLMYSKSLPFHIAWIPRYKSPKRGIDNDLSKDFSIYNADFLFTLDYMINRGGIVGLHGYTHQYKNGDSVDDSEFGEGYYSTVEDAEIRALKAINTSEKLDIPYKFFESPHYSCTFEQQAVFEKHFKYIFEPAQGVWNHRPYVSLRNKETIYVPAPLGYVENMDVKDMIKRIKDKPEGDLAALFYHPYKEFEFIVLNKLNDGYIDYSYLNNSILRKILNCLAEEGYSLVKITDITK
ncbi:hypothetical protein HMPREF1982_04306 [Clostridiales bacterium oral taxon 876 str. F0540]|nr:hypothetical protein HMPREF1982_04306 [Clostridiales bacterium oral taxon 876 str. F0540]